MTNGFKFSEPQIKLDLCGKEFFVTAGDDTAKICSDILSEAKARLARLKSGDSDEELCESGICEFLKSGIDRLIGAGSVDKIFDTRCQEISAMAELMCYIVTQIKSVFTKEE